MPLTTVIPGKGPSVTLKVDMSHYCKAYKRYRQEEEYIKKLNTQKKMAMLDTDEWKTIKSNCDSELSKIDFELLGTNGAILWIEIKKQLSSQCEKDSRIERILNASDHESPLGLVFINIFFLELLTNSMAARLQRYLKEPTEEIMLEMNLSFHLVENKFIVKIFDNGQGFSDEYKEKFNDDCEEKNHPIHLLEQHEIDPYISFGGMKNATNAFWNFIYQGLYCTEGNNKIRLYNIEPKQTSFKLDNIEGGGLIIIETPIEPFLPSDPLFIKKINFEKTTLEAITEESLDFSSLTEQEIPPFKLAAPPTKKPINHSFFRGANQRSQNEVTQSQKESLIL